ncbi:MAG TPA: DNA primase [Thermoleophilaceae bacterium]|jgi:DNA primase|nr:DNA primase [Thermoleophilaceae bacterium]
MGLFTRDSIDRLRDAIDMVDLVGAKTDLRRVGSRFTGLCPFHDERTPSFSVNADEKLFYCFGCQAKGDAIGFVEQAEGLDFPEAVEVLADRYGVKLERENDDPQAEERRRRRARLHSLLSRAARYYGTYLWDSREAGAARKYLAGRGLGDQVLAEFGVGYSPKAWDRMLVGAGQGGFRPEELVASGLAQRGREGSLYDRFRGRIMFPLSDFRGQVLGFGARAMSENQQPKYLNTSENDVYHKGRQLFGIHLARAHAAKSGRIVVVEGYTDVLALHQAGIRESVAIMGTALTQEQLSLLGRAAPLVVLALDADRSGQEAMLRVARATNDTQLHVVEMREGQDPADLIADSGPDAFSERLDGSVPMIQFQVRRVLADADLDTPAGRDQALEKAARLIAEHTREGSAMRDELVREGADRLDVPQEYVRGALSRPRPPAAPTPAPDRTERRPAPVARASAGEVALRAEREFLSRCLGSAELGERYLSLPQDEQFSSEATRRARKHLATHFDDPLAGLPEDEPTLAALVTDVALAAQEGAPSPEPVLQMSILQLEKRRLEREIRRAAQDGDHTRQSALAQAEQQVRGELDSVMGQTA